MHLTREASHTTWDPAHPPAVRVAPGAVVELELADASGGQVTQTSTAADIGRLDAAGLNPVTGPVFLEGAEPGDALVVEIVDVAVDGWGWTANIPGFGLLAADFPDPYLHVSAVSGGQVHFLGGLTIPVVPMLGTIGLAPATGPLPMIPPHLQGGNMDVRHVTGGATLRLPVAVPGALLSIGDTHAAMGDGEVCGTGIEIASRVTVRLGLEKGRTLRSPMLETDGRATRSGPALITTGIGPDLWQAARDAATALVEEIVHRTGLAPVEAYLLASVAADMHVSEIVDLPNVVVTMHLSTALLG